MQGRLGTSSKTYSFHRPHETIVLQIDQYSDKAAPQLERAASVSQDKPSTKHSLREYIVISLHLQEYTNTVLVQWHLGLTCLVRTFTLFMISDGFSQANIRISLLRLHRILKSVKAGIFRL